MNQPIIEESSSCDTATSSEPQATRQITLDVFYTSIFKDPQLLSLEPNIAKKRFFIFRDSYILAHRQNSKIKITHRKKQILKLLHDDFEIIAQVIFKRTQTGNYLFTVERNISPETCHPSFREILKKIQNERLNSVVFVNVRSRQEFIQSQEFSQIRRIRDNGFIKMGKEIYETRIIPYNTSIKAFKLSESNSDNKLCLNSKENTMECKICLVNEGQSKKDYIVSPCKCAGSCSAVHVECLKNWISQKIQVGKGNLKLRTYDMERFACEICKEKYPEIIQVENSIVDIAPRLKINSDTLILTRVFPVNEQKSYSHFISLEKGKAISVGRNYTNELILEDMSITRSHAAIYRSKDDNKFYIRDFNSRFGTFSSLKQPIQDLKEINLVSSRHSFLFKIVEDKKVSFPTSGEDEVTKEKIDY